MRKTKIYTDAPKHLDYPETVSRGVVGRLAGKTGKKVRLVEGTSRQAEMYLATFHLAADQKRWESLVKRGFAKATKKQKPAPKRARKKGG